MLEPIWDDARTQQLRKLWAEGLSCSQIANELACGFSCSAIIGKAHRLKLPARGEVMTGTPSPRPAAPPRPKPGKLSAVTSMPTYRQKRNPSGDPKVQRASDVAEPGIDVNLTGKPNGTGIKIHQLSDLNCHWPLGDPASPDFEFCGANAVAGRPYCAGHCRVAYQPLAARVRSPEEMLSRLRTAQPNNYYQR
ncbi:GcrA cell cycle regulator [Bradyrhizobium sp. Arg62]|uniref:GcrA family cell cycle regulator n=1 Tax=Bradyrhizobium brasilense TaxID=1419277 RepID=UPI001E5BA0EA|nr:GcrA family cell cycle regulator [Bradyrhizobium brasilense]MCC8945972.1 GcrA cell cycle regulator [Bradyrhizobium brasilense]